MKKIAILKETIKNEKRVVLLPANIKILSEEYEVMVESGAGKRLGIEDFCYSNKGANIVSKEEAWSADLVLKYKAPTNDEYQYLERAKAIGALFHAEGNYQLIRALINSNVVAYSYEFFKSEDGIFPMAFPGGEIAGKMAVMYACFFQQIQYGGSGKALFAVRGCRKSKIAIIGYGNVGGAAIKMATSLGNEVYVFGTNINLLKKQSVYFGENVYCFESTQENLETILPQMDAIIGCILISTYNTMPIITHEIMKKLRKGTVVVDVTCGYGTGYIPDIKGYTSLDNPICINERGVLYCKIDNLPSAYPITTTEAYSQNGIEWILKLARHVFEDQFYQEIENGKIIEKGCIVHPVIQQHWEYYNGCRNDIS